MKVLTLPNSDITVYIKKIDDDAKGIKDEIFRISWYMRGGVSSHDLFHVYSYEDRTIMNGIIRENIEATKNTKIALL
jgi:hypothetical protein